MRGYIFIVVALLFYGFNTTDMSKFRKVEIYQGISIYGSQSLKLTEEGLLIRNDDFLFKHKKRKISKFIPLFKLNKNKIAKITNYLESYNGFNDLYIKRDSLITTSSNPRVYIIRTYNYEKIKILIDHDRHCPELDSLKILMNDLIPRRFKKKYSL